MPRLDEASVLIGGQRITNWTRYRIDSDLMTPADGFDMEITLGGKHDDTTIEERARVVELTAPGQPVRVEVGDALQLDGVVDDQDVSSSDGKGTTIKIKGRDRAAFLVDANVSLHVQLQNDRMVVRRRPISVSSVLLDTGDGQILSPYARAPFAILPTLPAYEDVTERVTENATLLDLVRAVVEPWRIPVVTTGVEARDILTGRRVRDRAGHRRRMALAHGVPEETISRNVLRRNARGEGAVPDLIGDDVVVDSRAADDYANGLAPDAVERIKPKDARPKPGEKVWTFLQRHVQRFGLMMWMSPDGKLVLSSPNYNDDPAFRIVRRYRDREDDPNNVVAGSRRRSTGNRFSECTVYGRAPGGNVARSRFKGTAYDLDFPYFKPLTVHDQRIRDEEEAGRRAQRELNKRQIKGDVLKYTLSGHGQQYLFATDTVGTVIDEVTGVDSMYYTTKRTFTKSPDQGTATSMTLIPRGALVL